MKVSVTDLTAARKSLAIEVPADQVAGEYEKACRKYIRSLKVPGFRQGKVPLHIIKQRYGREIEQETVEHAIEEALRRAVSDAHLEPLRTPVLKEYKYSQGEPLTFTAEFEVRPKVEVKGASDIQVTQAVPDVTDKMLSEALDTLRERGARFVPVEGRGIRTADHVVMDATVRFEPGEGEEIVRENLMIEVGSGGPHPEMTEHLRNMMAGQTHEFSIAYPKEHPSAEIAGKKVTYNVTVREIKEKVLPDLDDDFARDLGKFKTLEDLRSKVREDLMQRERRRLQDAARHEVLEQLLKSNPDVAVPEALVDEELDRRVGEIARSMVMQGMDPRQQAVDWDDIRQKQREPAVKAVSATILLDAIAEEKKISLEDETLEKAISEEAERRRTTSEALRAQLTKDGRIKKLSEQLLREKVLDFLLASSNT